MQGIGARAFSRSATVTELHIPSSVTQIGNYIAADTALSAIFYAGTESDWSAVQKGSLWNLDNESVQIIFEGENDL
ncbi:MAG TPA: leucine-rich repeat domain-containing protein [Candidatus Borkfalkia excrementipullorum]|nr:leucine-rich repeat domain-containing protein [Candidatus Borkfalkia excrementipullorum]